MMPRLQTSCLFAVLVSPDWSSLERTTPVDPRTQLGFRLSCVALQDRATLLVSHRPQSPINLAVAYHSPSLLCLILNIGF